MTEQCESLRPPQMLAWKRIKNALLQCSLSRLACDLDVGGRDPSRPDVASHWHHLEMKALWFAKPQKSAPRLSRRCSSATPGRMPSRCLALSSCWRHEGATIWRDEDQILGGQYYGEQIVHAIAHSRVVMIMCSPQAFQSDNVHREVLLTWDHYHRGYLPVWLSPNTKIPERFRYCLAGCQWIDAHSQPPERWLPQLLKAMTALGVETTRRGGSTPAPDAAGGETSRRGFAVFARRQADPRCGLGTGAASWQRRLWRGLDGP